MLNKFRESSGDLGLTGSLRRADWDCAQAAAALAEARMVMNTTSLKSPQRALTVVEVLVVIATLLILAGLVLPYFAKARMRPSRTNCVSNLKQVGLSFRMFSLDHGDKFPWAVRKAEGGTLEYTNSTEVFRHFLALSNELITPKTLTCSPDLQRSITNNWVSFSNTNLSYFAALDAERGQPQTILSGDRTLSFDGARLRGTVLIRTNTFIRVYSNFHGGNLNLAFADGSAQQVTEQALQNLIRYTNDLPIRLAIP
jgi:prepilin-type processing-associated H-X9-DG protein